MGIFDSFFGGGNATNEALAKVITEGAFLVDVRGPGEFAGGSAKGAVNIPLDTITQHLNKFIFHSEKLLTHFWLILKIAKFHDLKKFKLTKMYPTTEKFVYKKSIYN